MKIENITIADYFSRENTDNYDIYIDALKPKNLFAGKIGNYNRLTYDEVEVIKQVLSSPNLENLIDIFGLLYSLENSKESTQEVFFKQSIFDLFQAQNYLKDFIVTVNKREKENLGGKPNDKMLMVNANERLRSFGHLLNKIKLAKQFGTTPTDIGSWKYRKVFSILVAEKRLEDVMNDINEIK